MILRNTPNVNSYFNRKRFYKLFILLASLGILAGLLTGPVSAQTFLPDNAVGYYTQNGQTFWLYAGKDVNVFPPGTGPGELETLFPMSAEAEKAIVHPIPQYPLVIDGVRYDAKDISLFDGIRLRFIVGDDGVLYAFTTIEGLEQFQQLLTDTSRLLDFTDSIFYEDWLLGGDSFSLASGCGLPALNEIFFDNCISSVEVSDTSWTYLYDYSWYGGDYFAMQPGSTHYSLTFEES